MLGRPHRIAATVVVPVPRNGSSTVSPTKLNMRTSRSASSSGNGAGWFFVDAPGTSLQIAWNHFWWFSAEMTLRILAAMEGLRYPPCLRSISMNSMSFLITAFGSYGLPRNELPFSTS